MEEESTSFAGWSINCEKGYRDNLLTDAQKESIRALHLAYDLFR